MRLKMMEKIARWSQGWFSAAERGNASAHPPTEDGMVERGDERDEALAYWMPMFPPC
jgi:hypothetical protein